MGALVAIAALLGATAYSRRPSSIHRQRVPCETRFIRACPLASRLGAQSCLQCLQRMRAWLGSCGTGTGQQWCDSMPAVSLPVPGAAAVPVPAPTPPGVVAREMCAASQLRTVTTGDAVLDARAQASSAIGGMAPSQYRMIIREVLRLRPTNLLVFSVGGDTALWRELNKGGKSVFFEDVPAWADKVRQMSPGADIRMLTYKTIPSQCIADALALGSADVARATAAVANYDFAEARRGVESIPWRIIHVDGPQGGTRGRIQSALMGIVVACSVARIHGGSVTLFFHDAQRPCENEISRQLFSARVVECQRWPDSERTAKGERSPQPEITLHRYNITADHESCRKPQFAIPSAEAP
eukprot:TRINITY_DN7703_c0_g1_i5.p2 TRINITY_DN7703_c0_g1~~TRINITY_DN7703_c0_g1_i5.p2  ORF type:complete len:355 (+),score=42.66 TRINITY_DN7703_c0_g1_i5:73-1137(+)